MGFNICRYYSHKSLLHSSEEISMRRDTFTQKTPYNGWTTMDELRAFTGLSCLLGVSKPGYVSEK
jgi:hypothetical protein